MSEASTENTPKKAIYDIIDCLSTGKTSKALKNNFEIISSTASKEYDEILSNFFIEKSNDNFFDQCKGSIKRYFDILLKSERPIYYFTAFLLSQSGIYTDQEGKDYYFKSLEAKYPPTVRYESERLSKSEKDLSKAYHFCTCHTDFDDDVLNFNIGVMTYFGIGTEEDQQTGINFIEKSGNKGYNPAIVVLAALYYKEKQDDYSKCISHLKQKNIENLSFKSFFLVEASKRLWNKISTNSILHPLFKDFEMMMLVSKDPQFSHLIEESTLTEINEGLFENDQNLKSIFIPPQVRKINNNAFKNCINLESIEFGTNSNLVEICEKSFFNCISLQKLILPRSVKILGISSFENNKSLSIIELNEGLITLSKRSFANCRSLKKLCIPSTLVDLNESSFSDCVELAFLEFSSKCILTNIGDYAFENTGLEKVEFPPSVKTTGMFCFHYCSKLTSVLFKKIEIIGKGTFHSCDGLCTVDIEENTLKIIGDGAFYSCVKLEEFNFPSDSKLKSIGNGAFQNCISLKNMKLDGVEYISELAFYSCSSFTEINIPGTVRVVSDQSFEACEQLKKVTLNDGVEIIGERCFYDCLNLEQVILPKTLKEIYPHAFDGCINLSDINIHKESVKIGEFAFGNCAKI